ncbi:M57 family metalloprotease [Paraliomyxa miuraensis]|uniref:M57 family metalloprotease n=1 Tax=Paraliomyxa miuraensis TaxID=376150 RepID=UPI00224D1BB6|nr:M57 family metalloprotease [Paraliomyxa miuraensis]MCX4244783.1 M57 family metalloprotease [Paraliomyxa miuraensis]
MLKRRRFHGFLALLALVEPLGCDVELADGESAELDDSDEVDPVLEIIENLRAAGYPEAEIQVREDGVVFVGGDAEVSLEASREMVGFTASGEGGHDDDIEFRQYHSTNLVSTIHDTICVNGSAFTGSLSTALDNAIANYTNLDLSFNLVRTSGATAGCDATITAVLMNGTGGSAGFPSGGLPYGTITIGDDIVSNYGLSVATHVITHEIGHCFGFRHSDYYDRSISCGGGVYDEGGAGVGAARVPGTPANAVNNGSVMNSCYNGGSTGQWTSTDLTALNALYSPRVTSRIDKNGSIVPGQGNWGTWHPTVYCKPGTYAVGYRMRVESYQGGGLWFGNDDTALNSVQLLCKDPATGKTSLISSHDGLWGSWYATSSCPGSNNYLKSARMRIESSQGGGNEDDTAANDVQFGCSQGETIHAPGGQGWGSWNSWKQCPSGTAVCGLRSRVESYQGDGDDTAMNGLDLKCCNLDGSPPPPPPPPPPPGGGGCLIEPCGGGCLIEPCPAEP